MIDFQQEMWGLVRGDLDLQLAPALAAPEQEALQFYRLKGLTDFWTGQESQEQFDRYFSDLLTGLNALGGTVAYLLLFRKEGAQLYLGATEAGTRAIAAALKGNLEATYPFIHLESARPEYRDLTVHGGMLCGFPTSKTVGPAPSLQMERLMRTMQGTEGGYLVLGQSIHPDQVAVANAYATEALDVGQRHLKSTLNEGALGVEVTSMLAQRYVDALSTLVEKFTHGRTQGMWSVASYYFARAAADAERMQAILTSIFSGPESKPETLRAIKPAGSTRLAAALSLPANVGTGHPIYRQVDACDHTYRTILHSIDLATLMQIPRVEVPGYYVDPFVRFDVAERRLGGDLRLGTILDVRQHTPNEYAIPVEDLTRHALIVGVTGGGKSNTARSLLRTLWHEKRKPFLVIESAKQEYWEMAAFDGFDDLLVFTVGVEGNDAVPYRLNPFEPMPGIALQTHLDYLMSIFKAAFDLWEPLPHILERCMHEVYESYGWNITQNVNFLGRSDYPTLRDLYYRIDDVVDSLGYDKRVNADMKGALKTRINSLRVGGKGKMLDVPRSVPLELILSRPVIFELEEIGDDDVKAFIIGALLVQLTEYRKAQGNSKDLLHVTLVEEAHRLLQNVPPSQGPSNPRAKAVQFFCNMLAEIRSYGEGIIIADQIPTKLASETVRNTNLKITHRIVMEDDRHCMGASMNMDAEQIRFLSTLRRGVAAVYSEGDTRPYLVQFPLVESPPRERLHRPGVLAEVRRRIAQTPALEPLDRAQQTEAGPFLYCTACPAPCTFRREVLPTLVGDAYLRSSARKVLDGKDGRWGWVQSRLLNGLFNGRPEAGALTYCYLSHLLDDLTLSLDDRRDLAVAFAKRLLTNGEGDANNG